MQGLLWRAVVCLAGAAALGSLVACDLEPVHSAQSTPASEEPPSADTLAERHDALSPASAGLAKWTSVVTLPLVPVSGANLPDGRVLLWSAEERFSFGTDRGRTYSLSFDPASNTSTERLVSETAHDMFCPGTATLADGRILVNGGLSSAKTSIFDPVTGVWTSAAAMNIPRAYQGTVPLADGSVLTLGGSWAGGVGNKHGEVWSEASGWRRLAGVLVDPFLSVDATRDFGMDSHLWLVPSGNGKVFHAGPGINMNWIDTKGDGRVSAAGRRGDDEFSINGNAVMYDLGKILKTGGAPGYDGPTANANAYVIDVNNGVSVRKLQSMAYRRAFHNSVVLPNGQVIIVGGMTVAVGFSDSNSVLTPELFDPLTETFVALPPMSVPRNYHSLALLLPDGRVLSTGGGLCGASCAANHADLQILSPPYLFNPDGSPALRPGILSAPSQAAHGSEMSVITDAPVGSFALVRMTSVTHAVNNDQRRLPLTFSEVGPNTYAVRVPANPGWALPGQYMLFALDAQGVPSLAKIIRIGTGAAPRILAIDDQGTSLGADTNLTLNVANPAGLPLSFSATGLPPGLSIQAATGTIQGNATQLGRYPVEVFASGSDQTVSTQLVWTVSDPGSTRYVMLEALSEIAGNAWSSASEINLLDDNGQVMPRGAWTVSADSAELVAGNHPAFNAIDGDPGSMWHTQWQGSTPALPHRFTIDLGGAFKVRGLRYLPRQDTSNNGSIAQFRVYLSGDGVSWGTAVSAGNFVSQGATKAEKTVFFDNVARGKSAVQSSSNGAQVAARAVDGNTNGVASGNSIAITNNEATPYWEVDLGASYQLFGVRLWNRTDSGTAALTNFYLLGSDTPMTGRSLSALLADSSVAGVQVPGAAGNVLLVNLAARARYVRVQLAGTNTLQLAEVEVFGRLGENRPPVLTQLSGVESVLGAATTLSLPGSDPDGDSLTYTADGLPPGLALNPGSGVVSGTPSVAGSYLVETSVADARGSNASMMFVWFVGVPLPVINAMSVPAIGSGGSASFTASTNANAAFEYKWSFGDGTPETEFSSAPGISHVFSAPGVYIVTLTVRNSEGGASSREFVQAVTSPAIAGTPRASSQLVLEPRSGASTRLWLANPDNNSVTLFDTANNTKLREVTVAAAPRSIARASDGRIWVVNKGASSISIINPSTFAIAQTIGLPRGAQPHGLVIGSDGNAYVALEALGRVLKLNNAGTTLATLDVGGAPRHLALSTAGDRLFVSRFITPAQPGEGSAFIDAVNGGATLLVVAPSNLTLVSSIKLRFSDKPDTTVSGRGLPNYLGALAISPDGTSGWLPSKQDNLERGVLRDGLNIDFQNTVRAISSRIDLASLSEDYPARIDHDNAGLASAAVYHPSGAYLFVTLETSRELAVLDAAGKRELFRVDTGRAPQSLLVSADGSALYVQNFMDRSLSVFDLRRLIEFGEARLPLLTTQASVATELLSAQVLRGKQLFYDARDPRLARDGYMSCASCHNDAGQDGRVWDLTGLGEGLRNTSSLRGRAGRMGRLHWSANFDEVQDFESQIRGLSQGTGLMTDSQLFTGTRSSPLGDAKAGVSTDLDALAAYLGSLTTFELSPFRTGSGALSSDAATGRNVFAARCAGCHIGNDYSDSASLSTRNVGTLKPASGKRLNGALVGLDTPTLRDVTSTAPYLHDGSAASIEAAIQAHAGITLTATDLANVAAFTRQIGSEELAVAPSVSAGTGLFGQYFPNYTLTGSPTASRTEAINFGWGSAAPISGIPADNFSVRWTGHLLAPSTGTYRFQTVSQDGVRVWVNGVRVINNWTSHTFGATDTSSDVALTAGQRYDVVVEYFERTGSATMRFNWRLPGSSSYVAVPAAQLYTPGTGLTGQYFASVDLSGSAALTRSEAINFDWTTGSPAASVPVDNFSARWTGKLAPLASGNYRLQTNSDDGVRVWLNDTLIIDNWTAHAPTLNASPVLSLVAGLRYELRVEYNELGGGALMQLTWQTPGATSFISVPVNQLYAP